MAEPKILNPDGMEFLLLAAQTIDAWRKLGRLDVATTIEEAVAKNRGAGPKLQAELDEFLYAPMDGSADGVIG